MNTRFLAFLFFVTTFSPFLIPEQPLLSSKAVRTAMRAKEIIHGSHQRPIGEAVISLESLLHEASFLRLDPEVQVDILLLLSQGYERQERFAEQEEFLLSYATKRSLYRYSILLKSALIHSYVRQGRFFEAEQLLSKLATPALSSSPLEEKTEIAKTLEFTENYLKETLFVADTQAKKGLLHQALKQYKTAFKCVEKYFFPFQASPVDKTRLHYALLLRIAELYYLLGDKPHAALLLSNWPEAAKECSGTGPLYARRLLLLYLIDYPQGTENSSNTPVFSNSSVEYLSWRAQEAIKGLDKQKLEEIICSLKEQKKEEYSGLIYTLQGFSSNMGNNFPEAFDFLEKALFSPNDSTVAWKQATHSLFAEIGLYRVLLLTLSHQREKAQSVARRVLAHTAEESCPKIQTQHSLIKECTENALPNFYDRLGEGACLSHRLSSSLKTYLDTLSAYQQAIAGNIFEEKALSILEQTSLLVPDAMPQLLAFRIDLLTRSGHASDACLFAQKLLREYPEYKLTDPTILLCMLTAESCPGFEKEVQLFQQTLLANHPSPQSLFLLFRLAGSNREWPSNLSAEQTSLLSSLQKREAARILLIEASKSKESGLIRDHVEKAYALFSAAIEAIHPLATAMKKESATILWGYLLSLHQERLLALETIITSPFAFNELHGKLTQSAEELDKIVSLYQMDHANPGIHPSFIQECQTLASVAELFSLAFTRDLDTLPALVAGYPQHLFHTSETACRGVLFAARVLYESHRVDEAMQLLSRLDETTIKDIHYELALEIALEKSLCLREKKHMKKAMSLLAWVINSPCASSLRIKAMILRADNYLATHREELAIKQLEAVVDKGGEWGAVAERKLLELHNTHGTT